MENTISSARADVDRVTKLIRKQRGKNLTSKIVGQLKIDDSMRIAGSFHEYSGWDAKLMRPQMNGVKPDGMWYSVGTSWLDWCQIEQWGGTPLYIDVFDVDESQIIKITTLAEFDAFEAEYGCVESTVLRAQERLRVHQEYGIVDENTVAIASFPQDSRGFGSGNPFTRAIDWNRVKGKYGGIEIAPYQWERRLSSFWYYGWDCASGCIWQESTLLSRRRLYNFNKEKNRYYKVKK